MNKFKEFLIEQEITYAGFKTRKPDEQDKEWGILLEKF
jgi:hypothetical protein